jgi:hypothetical protein
MRTASKRSAAKDSKGRHGGNRAGEHARRTGQVKVKRPSQAAGKAGTFEPLAPPERERTTGRWRSCVGLMIGTAALCVRCLISRSERNDDQIASRAATKPQP